MDEDFVIDLESGTEDTSPNKKDTTKLCNQSTSIDDNSMESSINPPEKNVKIVIESKLEVKKVGDFLGKKKPKKASSAKKPPRPPRGFSLDAADHKLIKEIAELAMIKRARIERMKALQHKKALKTSSSSSSMSGSLFATLFTVIFFLMLLLQGMSCRNSSVTSTPQTNDNGLVFIQEQLNPSASDSILPHSKSSNLFKKISGSGKVQ